MRIPEEEINAVRQHADIVQVIGKYLQIQKQGKDYVGLCPFHDDHSPSMHISPDKQIYKCFVCGSGGNVFTFVQNYEHISFPEAVERVASVVNIPLSVKATAEKPKDPHRERLYKVLTETIRYTMYQLDAEAGVKEKSYLQKRGLDEAVCQRFEIGYNPTADQLYRFLKAKGYAEEDMIACNVLQVGGYGMHDVFGGRITFPIHDPFGNPIGFSARTIDPQNPSKYINTNDTPLFHKSDLVYNAHRAKTEARRQGKIYVCEGVTDVIAFDRAGIQNVVCTLGTACTQQQIQILKGLAAQIVFCYDGDDAGQAATVRAGRMAQKAGVLVSVVKNTTGLDPDELLQSQGVQSLQALVKNEIAWMEFYLHYLADRTNFDNYLEKKDFAQKMQKEIAGLSDAIDRQYFMQKLTEMTGFHLSPVPEAPRPASYVPPSVVRMPDGLKQAEEKILAMMLASKKASRIFEENLGYLTDETNNAVAMLLVDAYRQSDRLELALLLDRAATQEEKNILAGLGSHWSLQTEFDAERLYGSMRKVMIHVKKQQAEALKAQLSKPLNMESRRLLLQEYQECLRDLRGYINEESNGKQ